MTSLLYSLGGVIAGGAIVWLLYWCRLPPSAFRLRPVAPRPDDLSEKEMDEALSVPATHPTYRAFMQIIRQGLEEAHLRAEDDLTLPRALEAHTGGAKCLREVMNDVLNRRARVEEERRRKNRRADHVKEQ